MNTIYFKTRESRYGGDIIDPSDRWSDREPTYEDYTSVWECKSCRHESAMDT